MNERPRLIDLSMEVFQGMMHSFTVSVLPVKWRGASAAPVRAVAIIQPSGCSTS